MACGACRNRSKSRQRGNSVRPSTADQAVDFTKLRPTKNKITGFDNHQYSLYRALTKNKPKGGTWGVDIVVGPSRYRVYDTTSQGVFDKVKLLFHQNEVEIDDLQIWANLNLQWIKGLTFRQSYVDWNDLKAIMEEVS